ncbi:Transmembrane component NikQ of energizing module of nickel ECF transporter [hydrothermal vent metagenome]|uniref:Transmembrane component NikQ of energizing module of nickel ECF transporter n=1 Tax=hydrothermal vent metagenome TaxID=652676 RepID=A0A3B0YT54_9ZZZZ
MALDIDRYAHIESQLQTWDPRYKIFSLSLFIIIVALLKTLPLAIAALLLALALLKLAKLPLYFVRQGLKWVILFLLPFLVILPLSHPGIAAFQVLGLGFSWEGLNLAIIVIIKATSIVITSYAIFATARFDVSMIALRHLKCPTVFVQMLLFTYRYLFVFMDEMKRMDTAMKARGFVKKANRATLTILGNFVGTLLVRSFERTERIYKAMLSKGYQGELHTLVVFQSKTSDLQKMGITLIITVLLIILDSSGLFTTTAQSGF